MLIPLSNTPPGGIWQLHEILRPFLIRRLKKDVLANDGLPPKREVVVYAGMTTVQRGYYELVCKNALRDTLASTLSRHELRKSLGTVLIRCPQVAA